ncbi:MAG: hypothetical protein BZY88_16255 [SAR202 cluster bacterium Io17-Chloro-G9]|nr:MAG: hypothetical protein BZY88_16255 [SAR202 cluster bacterium Io17-Chloro-G9]
MDRRTQLWESLKDQEYRQLFAEDVGTGLAFQIKLMREDRGWTQDELARRTGKKQEAISQLENPDYGRHSLTTLKKLASAFDVALAVRLVPFSELVNWTLEVDSKRLTPPSFLNDQLQLSHSGLDTGDALNVTGTLNTGIRIVLGNSTVGLDFSDPVVEGHRTDSGYIRLAGSDLGTDSSSSVRLGRPPIQSLEQYSQEDAARVA